MDSSWATFVSRVAVDVVTPWRLLGGPSRAFRLGPRAASPFGCCVCPCPVGGAELRFLFVTGRSDRVVELSFELKFALLVTVHVSMRFVWSKVGNEPIPEHLEG